MLIKFAPTIEPPIFDVAAPVIRLPAITLPDIVILLNVVFVIALIVLAFVKYRLLAVSITFDVYNPTQELDWIFPATVKFVRVPTVVI